MAVPADPISPSTVAPARDQAEGRPDAPARRRTSAWGLRGKLIVSMLVVGTIPLIAGLLLAFLQGSKEIREISGESFKALAIEASRKLDLVISEEIARTTRIADDPIVVQTLEQRRDVLHALTKTEHEALLARERTAWESSDSAVRRTVGDNALSRLLREYSAGSRSQADHATTHVVRSATKMLYLTDLEGHLVGALSLLPPFAHAEARWWQGAFHKGVGRLYLEDLKYDERAKAYVFTISVPVMDSLRYEAIGVLHRVIDATEFFAASIQPIRFGKTGHVMLIDSSGLVMSCPILPTGVRLSDPALIPLVTPLEAGWVHAPSDGHGGTSTSIIGHAMLPEASRATNGSLENGAWHTFVWQSSEELFAPITHLFTWMSIFGAVAILLLAGLGAVAATRIVTPIRQLQATAQAIGRRESPSPLTIATGDELQDLAEEITRMQAHIDRSFAGLTDEVAAKSREVQVLQQSTDRILDAVPTPIVLLDRAARVHYMNRACRDAFAIPLNAPVDGALFDVLDISPASRARLDRELRQLGSGQPLSRNAPATAIAEANAPRDPLTHSEQAAPDADRRELHIGATVYHYDWFRLEAVAGEPTRVGLVLRNTTDETRLQAAWIEAEKHGSLGVLTAGIGHELNNPLFGILGLGEAIQHETNPAHVAEFAKGIVQHGKRMAGIIRDFTGVTRSRSHERLVALDLAEQLDLAITAVERTAADWRIDVRRTYRPAPPIQAVPEDIQQALRNVVLNAVQAMKGTGTLTVAIEPTESAVVVRVQDTGPGIPPHQLHKVFDPFFTTKDQGEGSGLGLTIARRLVGKHGGAIKLDSAPGKGTTCSLTFALTPLPAHRQEVPA